jgi:anti-sigma factor RsiW
MTPESLTAWALDELSADEAAQVQRAMRSSPELARDAAELRDFTQMISEELSASPADAELGSVRRAALLAEVSRNLSAGTVLTPNFRSVPTGYRSEVGRRLETVRPRPLWARPAVLLSSLGAAACAMLYMGSRPTADKPAPGVIATATRDAGPGAESVSVQLASRSVPSNPKASGLAQPRCPHLAAR